MIFCDQSQSSNVIQNIEGIVSLIKKILSDQRVILSNSKFKQIERDYLTNIQTEKNIKIDNLIKKNKEKTKYLSTINDEPLFCLLMKKDFSKFENLKDVVIKKISKIEYKNSDYLNIQIVHLNILNNVNIKLNDSYKISRYLFDQIVRFGLRVFADALHLKDNFGISFSVLSSDKNFISKDDADFTLYQFYLPKKEILQYLNDDITGQKLADSSYILVDGERIELR